MPRKRSTENLPVGGGKDFPLTEAAKKRWLADLWTQTSLPPKRLEALFERYGTRAELIAKFILGDDDEQLSHKPDYSWREVGFLSLHEKIVHLDDLLLRRSSMAILGEVTVNLVGELAQVVGSALGWSPAKRQVEVSRTLEILADQHMVTFDQLEARFSGNDAKKLEKFISR